MSTISFKPKSNHFEVDNDICAMSLAHHRIMKFHDLVSF